MGFNWLLALVMPLLAFLNFAHAMNYFPKLNLKFTYNTKFPSNFSNLVKYDVDKDSVFEVYEDGTFNHILLTENKIYQNTYFNASA
jgi:hypothetical protein